MNRYNDTWDFNDEDYLPSGDDKELEYEEEWEEENEEYPYGYSPVQGNWDPREYEDTVGGFYKMSRQRVKKVQSMKTYDAVREKERKNQKKKIRSEAKTREKQRQKYYHYGNEDEV